MRPLTRTAIVAMIRPMNESSVSSSRADEFCGGAVPGPIEAGTGAPVSQQVKASSSIQLSHLSKTFPGQMALDAVSLTMRSDEVHCILGQNGCGKSTLIKILSGYHTFDPGSNIRVNEEEFLGGNPQESARLGLRFVHQQNGVIGELSALENLALGSGYSHTWCRRIDWSRERERARDLLQQVGRPDLDLDRPMALARAVDRTAVTIARAIDPSQGHIRFLFLDEPTAALPVSEVDHLMTLVGQVRERRVGVVYVTHRLDEVFRIADRVTILRDGRHISTLPVSGLTHDQLIELIVGRATTIAAHNARSPAPQPAKMAETSTPSLAVSGLRSDLIAGVDVTIQPGEVVGIAGLDGSGREEFCYALVGAVPSSMDNLEVNGDRVRERLSPHVAKRHGIALAPGNRQAGSAVRDFTIRENVTLPQLATYRRRGWIRKGWERAEVSTWLTRLSVRTSRDADPSSALFSQLSGGNQQKVVLAKWLATGPRALLLDEPTSGVDVGAREAIYQVIRSQAERGMGVLLNSSDIQDHLGICDRVLIMRQGLVGAELSGDNLTEGALLDGLMSAPVVVDA